MTALLRNNPWLLLPALVLAALGLFAPPATTQQDVTQQPARAGFIQQPGRIEVAAAELKTYWFTPAHAQPHEIEKLAARLYGRTLWVKDRGTDAGPVQNIQRLGDTIVIYDTEEYAQRLGEALHGMDEAAKREAEQQGHVIPEIVVAHWAPEHVGLNTAFSALNSFRRNTMMSDDFGTQQVPNIAIVSDVGQLVLRDTSAHVEQMIKVLERIDVPEQQLYVTCLVIRGGPSDVASAMPVPEEVTRNLSKLVPFDEFSFLSMGVVRTSALAENLGINMDEGFKLHLRNHGYDEVGRRLTAECSFTSRSGQSFETRTTIRSGEYTVLGASGGNPLFAVLKIEPVED